MIDEKDFLDWEGLAHYDVKNKKYINKFVNDRVEKIVEHKLEEKDFIPSTGGIFQGIVQFDDNVILTANNGAKYVLKINDDGMLYTELKDAPPKPDPEPEVVVPEETPEFVEDIIINNVPVYIIDGIGNLVPVKSTNEFYRIFTVQEAQKNSRDNYFYQIVDSHGALVESGYQIQTVYDTEDYMTVAIPETVKSFVVQQYDSLSNEWRATNYTLEKNLNYSLDGYITYTATDETEGGVVIRIVIKN